MVIMLLSVTCAQGAVKGTLGMVQGWAVRMGELIMVGRASSYSKTHQNLCNLK